MCELISDSSKGKAEIGFIEYQTTNGEISRERYVADIEEIHVGHKKIEKIIKFQNLENLRTLSLSCNEIEKIEGFEELKNLKSRYSFHNDATGSISANNR